MQEIAHMRLYYELCRHCLYPYHTSSAQLKYPATRRLASFHFPYPHTCANVYICFSCSISIHCDCRGYNWGNQTVQCQRLHYYHSTTFILFSLFVSVSQSFVTVLVVANSLWEFVPVVVQKMLLTNTN